MLISSLPNELLVDIFGRLDAESIEFVQCVNKRFDSLVEKHKLYKTIAHCIKFSSIRTNDVNHGISVLVTLPPKQNEVRQNQIRRTLNFIEEEKDDVIIKGLIDLVKKFRLIGTKSIVTHKLQRKDINVLEIFKQAEIRFQYLETIWSNRPYKCSFVTKNFLDTLVSRQLENICFQSCKTSIDFADIYAFLERNFETMPRGSVWQLGVYTVTPAQFQQVFDFLDLMRRNGVPAKYSASEEGSGIWHHTVRDEDRDVYFMWQEKET